MSIIITEVDVSVRVTDSESSNSDAGNSSMRDEIIKECVEQIMAIINNKNER
ncbi:MAG: hypothetical protein JWN56_2517 [Sphingobacteriales bacterium]|nr:hypothetical protein [Sphingobacteriales bacterium]